MFSLAPAVCSGLLLIADFCSALAQLPQSVARDARTLPAGRATTPTMQRSTALSLLSLALACGEGGESMDPTFAGGTMDPAATTGAATSDAGPTGSAGSDAAPGDDATDGGDAGPIFDVGVDDDTGSAGSRCEVSDELDGSGPCKLQAPADAFDPVTQWIWPAKDPGEGGLRFVYTAPLVANLTDDDSNGSIDLCDVPDVVVIAHRDWNGPSTPGALVVLDGATGVEHFVIEDAANASVTPALGDIDGDGLVEIVTATNDRRVIAYEHDGTLAWTSPQLWDGVAFAPYGMAVALADLDADGDVEIIAGETILDHLGTPLWTMPTPPGSTGANTTWTTHTAADLDGDGTLEVIAGHSAWRHDGTPYYTHVDLFLHQPDENLGGSAATLPAVADLDDDPEPEIVVISRRGLSVLEHDGTPKVLHATPIDPLPAPPDLYSPWYRPPTIHNFDADPEPEVAVSSADHYSAFDIGAAEPSVLWTAPVDDSSGSAAGTAFDFLGDGTAEAMYGDQNTLWVFDEDGAPLLQFPRSSGTVLEYPTVADIDDDGSAELLIPSDRYLADVAPGVRAVRDADDRWIPARRIWNQHTYHVTNVREDGTIPQHEPPHWQALNTFRTQAQLEGGGVCNPTPAG